MDEDASEPVSHGGCAPDTGLHCIGATLCGVHALLALKGAHLQWSILCNASASVHPSIDQPGLSKTMTAALLVWHTPFLMAAETESPRLEEAQAPGPHLSAHLAAMAAAHPAAPLIGGAAHCLTCLWLSPTAA